jgi:gliding motility-associated-like protein
VEIKTASGCTTIDTQLVKTVKAADIVVPSAFTPNKDGLNDFLHPVLLGIKELKYFRVYNRWGQLLYDMRSNGDGWDGTVGGTPQASQVVVWVAEALGVDNRVLTKKGTCVLVR